MEVWKPVPGWPKYEASSLGRIRSFHPWRGRPVPRVMATFPNNQGYIVARFKQGGRFKQGD